MSSFNPTCTGTMAEGKYSQCAINHLGLSHISYYHVLSGTNMANI